MSIKQFLSFTGERSGARVSRHETSRAQRAGEHAQGFDEAMLLMEQGHWERAFTRLADLADAGHPQAARIAMVYVQRGAALFGGTFSASARRRECWQRVANGPVL